jgi:hypothetical protein
VLVATFAVAVAAMVVFMAMRIGAQSDRNDDAAVVDHGSDVDPRSVYDPYAAGEELPYGYFPVLPRDAIRPVYDPSFTSADDIDWPDDADVIGVAVGDDARAYPVSYLNGREIVVDVIGGEPLLVSW